MEFSGRLSAFPPAHLLQWASNDRSTGALVVRHGRREKRIYFRRGDIVSCSTDDPAEYYGQRLLLDGYLTEPELRKALDWCARREKRLGTALLELKLLSAEEIRTTLAAQISDAVCDLFLWSGGVFFFEVDLPPAEEILPEPIHSMSLVMEATRWVDEHERIRRLFPHDHVILQRGVIPPEVVLGPLEQRIVGAVDGETPLDRLYRSVRGSWFRFLEAAYQLCLTEILDIASLGDGSRAASPETAVTDLLAEQAVAEARGHHALAVPLEALLGLCPRWVGTGPRSEALDDLSPELASFCRSLDGVTPLADALSAETRVRARQIELLVLVLGRGRLALVPGDGEASERSDGDADRAGAPRATPAGA